MGGARLRRRRRPLAADAWTDEELTRCLAALGEMAERLSPSPLPDLPRLVDAVADDSTRWETLVEHVPPELAALRRASLDVMDRDALVQPTTSC